MQYGYIAVQKSLDYNAFKGNKPSLARRQRMSTNPPEGENSYVLDAESGAELARLIDQDILFTKAMGGLFPRDLDLSTIHRVLDVACGPGGWAQEVAFTYPEIQITGIDISRVTTQVPSKEVKIQF
jgi:SAM-dependent methyltransferase